LEQVDSSGVNNICYVRINLTANSTVTTTIRQTGTGTDDETSVSSPQGFNTVFPNPFRNTASIGIKTAGGNVQLTVYNLKGEIVQALKNGYLPSGNHTYTWDGKDFSGKTCPSGLYLIRLSSASGTQNHKIVLVR
jgi:flagellar hook assembly protein FlgD